MKDGPTERSGDYGRGEGGDGGGGDRCGGGSGEGRRSDEPLDASRGMQLRLGGGAGGEAAAGQDGVGGGGGGGGEAAAGQDGVGGGGVGPPATSAHHVPAASNGNPPPSRRSEDDDGDGACGPGLTNELHDTLCGLGGWRPAWLQRLASKKTYALLHGLIGLCMMAVGTYFIGTISTLEKRFKIPSRTSGLIKSAWDIGTLSSLFLMGYLGRGHKPRYVALGMYVMAASCLIRLAPHWAYGPGMDALELTKEHGASDAVVSNSTSGEHSGALCGGTRDAVDDCSDGGSLGAPAIILFATNLMLGMGSSVYWTLGVAYLDDNTQKSKAPLALATTSCMQMLGPALGITFASYAVSKYVDPSLTPVIDTEDPRWIGAWWLGWAPFTGAFAVLASLMLLFPRQLPRAAQRRLHRQQSGAAPPTPQRQLSFSDFKKTFDRLVRNKVLMFNTLSGVCFLFGSIGYWVFMPKYMETIFRQSAAKANFISGSLGLVFMGLGVLTSGVVIARFKPRARALAAWCMAGQAMDIVCRVSWAFISCGDSDLHGAWAADNTWNLTAPCNAACNCGPEVKYSPVCTTDGTTTFYSPCHAGCIGSESFANGTMVYSGCGCAPGGVVLEGPCFQDCSFNFAFFLAMQCITTFVTVSGIAGNTLIQFRSVDEEDKPVAIAFSQSLICGLAFIPGPIIYGMMLDSACLAWGQICGKTGNCWLYDPKALRYRLNFTAASAFFCGLLNTIVMWYFSKNLQIYDDVKINETDKERKEDIELQIPFLKKA